MIEFNEPDPLIVTPYVGGKAKEPKTLPFNEYLEEVVMTLPYWRSSVTAARQGEEIFASIDARKYRLKDTTREALVTQMRLAESSVIPANPYLARAALRFLLLVEEAPKVADGE